MPSAAGSFGHGTSRTDASSSSIKGPLNAEVLNVDASSVWRGIGGRALSTFGLVVRGFVGAGIAVCSTVGEETLVSIKAMRVETRSVDSKVLFVEIRGSRFANRVDDAASQQYNKGETEQDRIIDEDAELIRQETQVALNRRTRPTNSATSRIDRVPQTDELKSRSAHATGCFCFSPSLQCAALKRWYTSQ
jgi:hypothetical protein